VDIGGFQPGLIPPVSLAAQSEEHRMKRVLIVEDQADIRELIRLTLELDDFEIQERVNGDEGLLAVASFKPDLVLLDVMMPGSLDGFQVCQRIKQSATSKRTKVVILTARTQDADQQAGKQAGADGFLTKPFSPRQLLEVVQRQLG
jgi:DNA-binding response OmpR family regulator